MLNILRGLAVFLLILVSFNTVSVNTANAQFTILPQAAEGTTDSDCKSMLDVYELQSSQYFKDLSTQGKENILACGIRTGRISFSMLPYFVTYIANFLLSLSGIIAVLFIVIGGYNYIYGGITDQKEKGKKTVMHALMGMWVAILSWVIVQVVLTAVTS